MFHILGNILLKCCGFAKYVSHFKKQENKQNSKEKALSAVFSTARADTGQEVSTVTMALTGGTDPQQPLQDTSERCFCRKLRTLVSRMSIQFHDPLSFKNMKFP